MQDRGQTFGTELESARVLTSHEHAQQRAPQIVQPVSTAPRQTPIRIPARKPTGVAPGYDFEETPGALPWARPDRENTTHLSTADRFGGVVALTQSLGPGLGTRVAASGTGVLFATRLGATPGSRPSSTIAPTIVLRDGQVRYLLGGAGDNRIITAVTQTLSRVLDQGRSLEQAVAAPRGHPLAARQIRLEGGVWPESARARLQSLGFELSDGPSTYFGRIYAISIDPTTRVLTGVAEPRGYGGAAAPIR